MWVDRVFAEKQIKIISTENFSNSHEHFKFVNNYAAYLYKAVKNSNSAKIDYAEIFKKWIFNSENNRNLTFKKTASTHSEKDINENLLTKENSENKNLSSLN